MKVRIPSVLYQYTDNQRNVEASGSTVEEVLNDLDRQFPGIKFRFIDEQDKIRPHMLIFLNKVNVLDITENVTEKDELFITQALSGG